MESDDDDNFSLGSDSSAENVKPNNNEKKRKVANIKDDDEDDLSLGSDSSGEKVKSKSKKKTPVVAEKKSSAKSSSTSAASATSSKTSVPKSSSSSSESKATPSIISSSSSSASSSGLNIAATVGTQVENSWKGPDVTTESAAKALIYKYMSQQNRPYSVIQIFENLHKRIQKPTIERCLTAMSEASTIGNRLICKEYGKAKIYYLDQSGFQIMSEKDINQLQSDLSTLQTQVDRRQQKEQQLRAQIAVIAAEPSDSELDTILAEAEARLAEQQKVWQSFATLGPVDPKEFDKAVKEYNRTRGLWRDRKLACAEALDMISDSMGKKLKTVVGEMGIETDEESNTFLPVVLAERTSNSSNSNSSSSSSSRSSK